MNYIGSKYSLLGFLEEAIIKIAGKNNEYFCDLFAGTGVTGLHFKKLGYKIISNDLQYFSYVLNRHYIMNHKKLEFLGLLKLIPGLAVSNDRGAMVCEYLNNLAGIEGFTYWEYCPNRKNDRRYFTSENGKKCDAIRQQIEIYRKNNNINDNEYFFLIASLLECVDKVANTASVYGSFLKKYKKSALKELEFKPIILYENDNEHYVYNEDANSLIENIETDILYLDPPYNHRQYSTNYHVLETIAKYDNPVLKGATGLRDYKDQKSKYCSKVEVKKTFSELIEKAKAKYIFLSYNNEGLLSLEDIKEVFQQKGEYGFFTKEYSRFKADNKREYLSNTTTEYIHYCIVSI